MIINYIPQMFFKRKIKIRANSGCIYQLEFGYDKIYKSRVVSIDTREKDFALHYKMFDIMKNIGLNCIGTGENWYLFICPIRKRCELIKEIRKS